MAELTRRPPLPQEEAFLAAIRADPDDDTHRLVYADWLQEFGDEHEAARGEMIQLECQRLRLPANAPQAFELAARVEELRARHEKVWRTSAPNLVNWAYDRGLLDSVDLSISDFLDQADELFRLGPLREVELRGPRHDWSRLLRAPALERVHCLILLSLELDTTDLEDLFHSPHAAGLSGLILGPSMLGPEGVRLLTEAPCFGRLKTLGLSNNKLGANGVEVLARAAYLAPLVELHLDRTDMGIAGMQWLAEAQLLSLRRLSLQMNELGERGMSLLGHRGHLPRLEELRLSSNPLGNDGVRALASSAQLPCLAVLDLSHTQLGRSGASALARSTGLHGLANVDLSGNRLGAGGALQLAKASWPRLTRLWLSANEIGDEGLKALAASPLLATVTQLGLGANGLRVWSAHELTISPHLGRLHTLDLTGNQLGDDGAQVLARWPQLASLIDLRLRNNHIGDKGASALLESPHLSRLCAIDLGSNDLSAGQKAAWQQAQAEGRVRGVYL